MLLHQPLASWIGLTQPLYLVLIGFVLLPFGLRLIGTAKSGKITWAEALTISAMDLSWVVITLLVLLIVPDLLATSGIIAAAAVASVVFVFFELQIYALWRARQR